MHLSNGQAILLDWFKHNSDSIHNLSKIRVICQNISMMEGFDNDSNYLYRYFFPLFRIGIIEYYGSDNYSLSHPVLYAKGDIIIAVNFDSITSKSIIPFTKSSFFNGLVLYFDIQFKKQIELELKTNCLVLKNESLFQSVPNLHNYINSLETLIIDPDSGFQKYNYFEWTSVFNPNEMGCYKASENVASKRYILTPAIQWKKIPDRNTNPDAFNLAVCYSKVESHQNLGIKYDNQKMELKIFDIHFPIILERLLWLSYLNRLGDVVVEGNNQLVFKNFLPASFKHLNKFFMNKIKIL